MKKIVIRIALSLLLGVPICIAFIAVGSEQAEAQVLPPPPPPPAPLASHTSEHGGHKGKFTSESFLQIQAASIICSAIANIGDSIVKARGPSGRELTPVGAIDNAAACGFVPAMLLKTINWSLGIKDNACSLGVARRALRQNNTVQGKQELLWRDGSFERRQAKLLDQYMACYRRK
jgi:hypothetical protein